VTETPLVPGPLYGLRAWRVVGDERGERLAAPHRGTTWPTEGEWLQATCSTKAHSAPAAGCDCGVHAFHPSRAAAKRVLAVRREVAGIVEAGGAVEVHEDGFRAERGRPHALVLAPGGNAQLVRRLAREYGAETIEVRRADDLLAYCREHGLGLSDTVVRDLLGPGHAADRSARRRRRRRNDVLRVAIVLAVAALLVVLGLQIAPDNSGDTVYGRTGEVQRP
jgi:hypothetical protein